MIENERKYVLLPSIEEELSNIDYYQRINQGYIQNAAEGLQVRFRKVKFYKNGVKVDTKRIFTLKSKNTNFTSTEIEIELSKRDFDSIWPKVHYRLTKTRYKFPDDSLWWEIDVFHKSSANYFWMAEVELPEDQLWPVNVPSCIEKHLLHIVPLTDNRFSSRKLCDQSYASNLFEQIEREKNENKERI